MLLVSGTPSLLGAIDGRNTLFVAQAALSVDAIVSINGLSRAPGDVTSNGYTVSGQTVQLQEPLVPGDILTVYLPPAASPSPPLAVRVGGPRPSSGSATALRPSGAAVSRAAAASGSATLLRPSVGAAALPYPPAITGTAQRT